MSTGATELSFGKEGSSENSNYSQKILAFGYKHTIMIIIMLCVMTHMKMRVGKSCLG